MNCEKIHNGPTRTSGNRRRFVVQTFHIDFRAIPITALSLSDVIIEKSVTSKTENCGNNRYKIYI
jgi:hypothetical protein